MNYYYYFTVYSPSKKRKVTFSQSADIINGGRVPDPVQPQHDNMSLVTSVTTPTNHSPSVNRQSLNKQRSGIIIMYTYCHY